jgi:hypothetical protein
MQDRYVADIGDFGKFQLFRFLFNTKESALAQIWFYHDREEKNNDGKYCHYFSRVKGSDDALSSIMQEILAEDNRTLYALEKKEILSYADYFYQVLPESYQDRVTWINKAYTFSKNHPIVAVAPDNGIALKCHKKEQQFSFVDYHDKKNLAHKYIFKEEIDTFFHTPKRQITILYQHLGRCFSHDLQRQSLHKLLKIHYPFTLVIKHKPYSPRLFFFLCKDAKIAANLEQKLNIFAKLHSRFWEFYR